MTNQKKTTRLDRRTFVRGSAAGVAATGYFTSRSQAQSAAANESLSIACIGTANRAAADIQAVAHESIVALCDVDRNFLSRKQQEFPNARPYEDYREMLDREGDRIDAVVIGTADHHHAPAAMRAIGAGKHVYCEKPLTHTVEEARLLARAAKEAGVATQMGIQIHAGENYRRVVEIIRAGILGAIHDVHVWVGKGWGGGERPEQPETPPPHLNWDLWLGPAPERPFAAERYHPVEWRRWWDFGQGTLGDMACHYMDLPFWALELTHPSQIEAEGPQVHPETAPLGLVVRYRFPAIASRPALNLTWYDGTLIPKMINGVPVKSNGVMFLGERGMMFADYTKYQLFPSESFVDFQPPPRSIPASIGHHQEWLKACRDGSDTSCNFQYSGPLTEAVLLGNVAFRSGKKIQWNAEKLVADQPEAQKLVGKDYRDGWQVSL